jgi:hypothetical protein
MHWTQITLMRSLPATKQMCLFHKYETKWGHAIAMQGDCLGYARLVLMWGLYTWALRDTKQSSPLRRDNLCVVCFFRSCSLCNWSLGCWVSMQINENRIELNLIELLLLLFNVHIFFPVMWLTYMEASPLPHLIFSNWSRIHSPTSHFLHFSRA